MLTRASVKINWSMNDVDWDERMAMTDDQIAQEDAEFKRECATRERELQAKLNRMTTLKRYRYERHNLLVSLLRCRTRLDKYRGDPTLDFMADRELAFLRKRQTELLGWRDFLVTGIVPNNLRQ